MDRVPETGYSGILGISQKMGFEKAGFAKISGIFDGFFQSFTVTPAHFTLKNHQKFLEPISPWHFQSPKPRFRVPDPSLCTSASK